MGERRDPYTPLSIVRKVSATYGSIAPPNHCRCLWVPAFAGTTCGGCMRHHIPPAPAPGTRVVRLCATRHRCDGKADRRAQFCGHRDLADVGWREHAGAGTRDRCARQYGIGELFILEG